MNIKVDLEKMKEIHGEDVIEAIYDNIDIIERNINVMKKLKFDDIESIFERCPSIFMKFLSNFTEQIENLISELGDDYVEIIQSDISIIEERLD